MPEPTPAEVYDQLQQRFGIGNWDEATSKVPWWKARITEISKLKAMLTRRRVKTSDVLLAADYAERHRVPIRETWELFQVIDAAKRERRQTPTTTDVQTRLAAAVQEATECGEPAWAARLYNTDPRVAEDALAAWASHSKGQNA